MKNTLLTTDWAPAMEAAARSIATVLVAVYCAGLVAGQILHAANTKLAKAYACLLAGHQAAAEVVEAAFDALEPTAAALDRYVLEALNVHQLRTLARQQLGSAARLEGRRIAQARKADLLAALA